jgi:hypothetical protein
MLLTIIKTSVDHSQDSVQEMVNQLTDTEHLVYNWAWGFLRKAVLLVVGDNLSYALFTLTNYIL